MLQQDREVKICSDEKVNMALIASGDLKTVQIYTTSDTYLNVVVVVVTWWMTTVTPRPPWQCSAAVWWVNCGPTSLPFDRAL